jgi:hypothetical protein
MNDENQMPKPETVSAGALLSLEMPPVTGNPETETGPKPKPETETAGWPELNGRRYDPARYRLNAAVPIFLHRHGHPMPGGGRKAGAGAGAPRSFIPPETETGPAPDTTPEPAAKPEAAPEAATPAGARRATARAGTRLLYTATGIVTGNPDEAVPPAREDEELKDTATYIMEGSGWVPGPLVALVIMVVSYGIYVASRPKNNAALQARWKSLLKGREKNVTPSPDEKAGTTKGHTKTADAAPSSAASAKPAAGEFVSAFNP